MWNESAWKDSSSVKTDILNISFELTASQKSKQIKILCPPRLESFDIKVYMNY